MMRNYLLLLIAATLFLGGGCSWAGRVAGKTAATAENIADKAREAPDKIEDGYDQGYKQKRHPPAEENK